MKSNFFIIFLIQCSKFINFYLSCLESFLILNFSNIFTEPTGNLSPKAPGEKYEGGKIITSANKKTVHIICNVIGFPIPIYRYVIHFKIYND